MDEPGSARSGCHRRLSQGVEPFEVAGERDQVPFAADFLEAAQESRAERDSLLKAARRAGAAAPGKLPEPERAFAARP